MNDLHCDVSEWEEFDLDVLNFVEKEMPNECKKFMRREGNHLKTKTKKESRTKIHKKTGNYMKGMKSTKSWQNARGGYAVKVRADHKIAPHSHLIEYGHRIVTKTGRDTGDRATAYHIYEKANEHFQNTFFNETKDFVGKMMENGLKGK